MRSAWDKLPGKVRQEPDGTLLHVFSIVGAQGPVAQVQWSDMPVPGGEAVVYLHPDHLGSVESVTDHRGGVLESRKYDPFGQRKDPANPARIRSPGETEDLCPGGEAASIPSPSGRGSG